MNQSGIFKLPAEVLLEISQKLSLKSLNALCRSCKTTHQRINPILYELDAKSPLRWALYWSCIVGNVSTAAISIASGSPIDQYCDAQLARPWEPTWMDPVFWESSPLDIALRRRHHEVVELLRQNGAKATSWYILEQLIADVQQEEFLTIIAQLRSQPYTHEFEEMSLYSIAVENKRSDLLPYFWNTSTRPERLRQNSSNNVSEKAFLLLSESDRWTLSKRSSK